MSEFQKKALCCEECNCGLSELPTSLTYCGQEIHLFNPALCRACLEQLCREYSTECVNCNQPIPPYSQVGVLKADNGETSLVHMTLDCLTVGSAFHGYWGKGKLRKFVEIEAC